MTDETRNQIWAEAVELWQAGEPLYLTDEQEKLALEAQEMHTETSSMEGEILEYLEIPIMEDWYKRSKQERREYIQGWGRIFRKKARLLETEYVSQKFGMNCTTGILKHTSS